MITDWVLSLEYVYLLMQRTLSTPSFCQTQRSKLIDAIQSIKERARQGLIFLVADSQAMTLLDFIFTEVDKAKMDIHSLLKLQDKRASNNKYYTIYLVTPKTSSIELIANDFLQSIKYERVDILSLGMIPSQGMGLIKSNKSLKDHLKGLNEIYLDFVPWLDNGFTFQMSNSFLKFHTNQWIADTSRKLVSVLLSLQKFSSFELIYPHELQQLASIVQRELQQAIGILKKYSYKGLASGLPPTRVLLFPREFDYQSPLMRSFDYLPLLYDFFKITRNRVKVKQKSKEESDHLLSEKDPVLWEVKYMNFPEATQFIGVLAQKQVSGKNQDIEGKGYKAIIQTMKSNFVVDHIEIHMALMEEMEKKAQKLKDITVLEQTVVNGVDEYGRKLDDKAILKLIIEHFGSQKEILETTLLQFVALCYFCLTTIKGAPDFQNITKISEKKCSQLFSIISQLQSNPTKLKQKEGAEKPDLFRHQPKVIHFLKQHLAESNSYNLKKRTVGESQKLVRKLQKYGEQSKLIVFVTGYLGVNELVALNRVEKNMIVGSNKIVSPWQYLEELLESSRGV